MKVIVEENKLNTEIIEVDEYGIVNIQSMCGKHILSGVELYRKNGTYILYFVLDGIIYKYVNSIFGDDEFVGRVELFKEQKAILDYLFDGVKVNIYVKENSWYEKSLGVAAHSENLCMDDCENGRNIINCGNTKYGSNNRIHSNIWYAPDRMACNENCFDAKIYGEPYAWCF